MGERAKLSHPFYYLSLLWYNIDNEEISNSDIGNFDNVGNCLGFMVIRKGGIFF